MLPLRKKGERTQPDYHVLGMVTKPNCLPASSWVWDPCATVHTPSLPCPSPGSLGCPSSDIGRGWLRWGKQEHGCLQPFRMPFWVWGIWADKNLPTLGRAEVKQPGQRKVPHMVRTEAVGRISPLCHCGHLKLWVCCSAMSYPWNLVLCYAETVLRVWDNGILHQNAVCTSPSRLMNMQNLHKIIKNH